MLFLRQLVYLGSFSMALAQASEDWAFDLSYGDDSDLTNFETRPEIKAPILDVTKYDPENVSPGYFFVAPFAKVYQENPAVGYWQPCQTGPHIYDSDGNLVWSGACKSANKNTADFRPVYYDGGWHLSAIRTGLEDRNRDYGSGNSTGYGYLLNASYDLETRVKAPKAVDTFNMQEFLVVDNGKSALSIVDRPEYVDVSTVEGVWRDAGYVDNMGFQEVDVATGETKFIWWALDHVPLTESEAEFGAIDGPPPSAWNFFHLNSVDKSSDGDYLISSRHTNAVYRISGKDGSVQWRLGGKSSTFTLDGFEFLRQHDARFLNPETVPFKTEKGLEYISIFNNAADEYDEDPPSPTVLIIALDREQRTANLVRQVTRPDELITRYSGNSNFLENGNLFVGWAGDAYSTEHGADNSVLMEARFRSDRFTTWRTFKGDFKGFSSEDVALKCTAHGTSAAKATTVCWVSWNGATEVRRWRFRSAPETRSKEDEGGVVGTVQKMGFETRIQIRGYKSTVVAEALDANEKVLGVSEPLQVSVQQSWNHPSESEPAHAELK